MHIFILICVTWLLWYYSPWRGAMIEKEIAEGKRRFAAFKREFDARYEANIAAGMSHKDAYKAAQFIPKR
jgi:hypothetical protein